MSLFKLMGPRRGRAGYRIMVGGLVPALVAAMLVSLTSAAAQASVASGPHRPAAAAVPGPTSAALRSFERRVLRLARQMAAGRGPSSRLARVGWFIPVDCYCLMASEKTFQNALEAVFRVAAPLDHMDVKVQPQTRMKINGHTPIRIPDIYYFRLNKSHPSRGLGFINELKVGSMGMSRRNTEASADHQLVRQGHGTGENTATKGRFLPVTAALWWFAPDVGGHTYGNSTFIAHLLSLGINVIYMVQNPHARAWPRRESRKRKAKDVKEIESDSTSSAQKGLNDMMQPCIMACPAP